MDRPKAKPGNIGINGVDFSGLITSEGDYGLIVKEVCSWLGIKFDIVILKLKIEAPIIWRVDYDLGIEWVITLEQFMTLIVQLSNSGNPHASEILAAISQDN